MLTKSFTQTSTAAARLPPAFSPLQVAALVVPRGGSSHPHFSLSSAILSSSLFFLSGLCEIGGGYLIWQTIREDSQPYKALVGAALLALYGFVTTLQPEAAGDEFGRLDAAYGGIFIVMSFLWGKVFDGMKIDKGDLIGGSMCLAGVVIILTYPRAIQ